MTLTKLKEFLKCGALLQVGSDTFSLILGPFESIQQDLVAYQSQKPLLFQPHFWDFLKSENQSVFLQGAESFKLTRTELIALLSQLPATPYGSKWQKPVEALFKDQFDWSIEKFKQKILRKSVPIISQKSSQKFDLENLIFALTNLVSEKKFGWTYGYWNQGEGYLGHSPELICQWQKRDCLLKTTALAGTLPAGLNASDELLKDQKNIGEHQIVIDDITNKINDQSEFNRHKTEVLKLPHLVHLKTEFTMAAQTNIEALGVIRKLHPTAALGLFPAKKTEYQEFKMLQEPLHRKNFAAPFAFLESDLVMSIAAIRNFHFSSEGLEIFSGCGVTALSQFESELRELTQKRNSVKSMMGFQGD